MKLAILFCMFLTIVLLVDDSEAGWFRIRIRFGGICRGACRRLCHIPVRNNWSGRQVCKFACRKACGKKRREVVEEGLHETRLPVNFDFYDLNDDNFIEIVEFAASLGHDPTEKELVLGFNMTDINNDGRLSYEEMLGEGCAFTLADPLFESPRAQV